MHKPLYLSTVKPGGFYFHLYVRYSAPSLGEAARAAPFSGRASLRDRSFRSLRTLLRTLRVSGPPRVLYAQNRERVPPPALNLSPRLVFYSRVTHSGLRLASSLADSFFFRPVLHLYTSRESSLPPDVDSTILLDKFGRSHDFQGMCLVIYWLSGQIEARPTLDINGPRGSSNLVVVGQTGINQTPGTHYYSLPG